MFVIRELMLLLTEATEAAVFSTDSSVAISKNLPKVKRKAVITTATIKMIARVSCTLTLIFTNFYLQADISKGHSVVFSRHGALIPMIHLKYDDMQHNDAAIFLLIPGYLFCNGHLHKDISNKTDS